MLTRVVFLLLWSVAAGNVRAEPTVRFEAAFANLRFNRPLYITHPRDGTDRLFVVEQAGRVLWFNNRADAQQVHVALDFRQRVRSPDNRGNRGHNEEGLLGLAFHPDFENNRQVYLHYSAAPPRRGVISRFLMDEQRGLILPETEMVVLEVEQPWGNHNGGMIEFGPDGYLYITLGDGGAAGDPQNNGQDRGTLLGAILRIDVDQPTGTQPYAIPADNPLTADPQARGEIWAYGLRNVWRFSFDRKTGDLWAGDVGQDRWEEIDLIVKGGNYGWNIREGQQAYRQRPSGPLIDPIVVHGRHEARSITGGYVYRGRELPALQGAYIYGDFVTGIVWALRYDGSRVTEHQALATAPLIASFGEDREGELYLCSFDGRIYKLVAR